MRQPSAAILLRKTLLGNGRRFLVVFGLLAWCAASAQPVWRTARNYAEINSAADDFAPAASGGNVYFSSERSGRSLLYMAEMLPDGSFGRPKALPSPPNPVRGGISYLSFLPGGGALVSAFRLASGKSVLNIAATDRGAWSSPTFLAELASGNFTAHPAVSPDGATLAFSSDRDGGLGGADLWFSYRLPSGAWGAPVHGGEVVNSPGHDITPFFAANDTLYFSSDGFGGAGGFEIFMSVLTDGAWSAPVPLAELNTEDDESDFVQISDAAALFTSSRRGGAGGLDLYAAVRGNAPQPTAPPEAVLAVQTGSVTLRTGAAASVPLTTFALFPKNSADFSPKTATDSATLQSLDAIATRMKASPSATLTLTGWTDKSTPKETIELAGKRAEAIRNYLTNNNIERDRIIVAAREHPAGERGGALLYRVDFASATANLFNRIARTPQGGEYDPATLECIADARPRGAIVSWTCRAGSETLASGRSVPSKFSVPAARAVRAADSAFLTLTLADSLGQTSEYLLALPVIRITTGNGGALAAPDAAVAGDPLRVLEVVEAALAAHSPDDVRAVLYAQLPPRAPDAADEAYGIARRRFGTGRVKLSRTERFAEMLPPGLREFAPSVILIGVEPAGEK